MRVKKTMLTPYPTYKDSGVPWLGRIPEHWKIVPGFSAFQEKFLKNTGMIEQTVLSLSYGRLVVKPAHKLHGLVPESFETYQIVDPGEIIIRPTDLQNDWNSLRVGIARNRGIITSAYICLRTLENVIPDYGYLVLHAYDLMKVFYGMGSGLRQNLDFKDLKRMPVAIPTIEEQRQIVKFLNVKTAQIARFIRSKQRMIALLKEQKQAIINQAVTGQINVCAFSDFSGSCVKDFNANDATGATDASVQRRYPSYKPSGVAWLAEIPAHWEILPLRRVADTVKTGGTPSGAGEQYYTSEGFNWYTPGDFKEDLFLEKSARQLSPLGIAHVKTFPQNTVMMIGIGATIGKVAICKDRSSCNQQINAIILNSRVIGEYFVLFLRSLKNFIIACGKYTTLPIINQEETKSLPIFIPPIDEQFLIVEHIKTENKTIDGAIVRIEREIALIQEYRVRLIADVVTGQMDVCGLAVPDVAADAAEEDISIEEDTENNLTQEAQETL